MCGFAGVFSSTETPKVSTSMVDAIAHRGPDELRHFSNGKLSTVFSRLAIVGVRDGSQPFVDSTTGTVAMVNGEIYNHRSLRTFLVGQGHTFQTSSDAEVVLAGFREWGDGVFSRLEGMWAASVFDPESETIHLSRDRLGKKPLYFRQAGHSLLFGSELPAVYNYSAECASVHLARYLVTDAISWLEHCACGVREVRPGSVFRWNENSENERMYWDIYRAVAQERAELGGREDNLVRLRSRIVSAVQDRLMSDVPVGVFLSAGVDSQLVATIAQRLCGLQRAYTLRFTGLGFNESETARKFGAHIGLEVEEVSAGLDDLAEMWFLWKQNIDEPFADSAVLAEMLLARAASSETKVVLTGDGGDEGFLGYQHIPAHFLAQNRLGRVLGRLATTGFRNILPHKKPEERYFSMNFVLDRLSRGLNEEELISRDLAWRVAHSPERGADLLGELYLSQRRELVNWEFSQVSDEMHWTQRWSLSYAELYLRDVIFRKVDRGTMRFGVEARSPLMDHRVFTMGVAMPALQKVGWYRRKLPLRRLLAEIEPRWTEKSQKHGMSLPLATLLTGPLKAEVKALLDPEWLQTLGLSPRAVEVLEKQFERQPALLAREVFSLMTFSAFAKRFYPLRPA